ncbi:hypothetical protein DYB36_000894 [Aphanomyces astaci]|uniref:Uncharacterized protein n=1 Tax=Aphanomyces astaci TaxID=112090 RepID=A0A397ADK2_APHAT|nr:hypothetical protein DYB36_000894 [Aphanomyces astaci]
MLAFDSDLVMVVETSTASSFQPNHCIEYFDPVKMQQHLLATSISDENNVMATKGVCGATMSFAKVEQYLSGGGGRSSRGGNGTGQDMTIGKVSLLDLKATMQANDVEMEKLRRHVKKEREKEKADELRGLKLKQQKALLQKKQVGMNLLEDERKRELAELVKQKEILTQKEQAALHEIQALEKRVKDQELQHRDDERKVLATIQRMDDGSKGDARVRALRATHMQRSQTYGAQAALLGHKRMELQQLQEKLKNDMTNLDVRHTRGDNQADDDNAAAGVISFNYDEEKHRVKNFDGQFETVKLQQQLEAMKQLKEQRELEMETLRFQQMIQSIQGKLPGAANGLFTNAPTGQQQSMSAQSSSSDLAPKIALAVADELESKELKALKLKHAEDMLKLKQQRDLMEEEERVHMKEQREKRRREMDEQMAQEEWMANQKRMVMALRMKKVLAQEQPLAPSMTDDMAASGDVRPYDPELGFSVFWDYILLVPAKASFLQVTYAVYEGSILRTKHKVIRARDCEPHGPSISGDHGTAQYTALLSALRPSDPKEWTHSSSDCVQLVLSLPSSSVPLYSSEDRSIDPSTGLVTAGPWKVPLFSVPKPLSHNQPIIITLSHKRSGGVVELYSATLTLEDAGGHDVIWDEQLCDLYSNPRNIPPQTLFGRGDGFNVYVDGVRSLPDPVTISKVTCFALNADMTSVSPLQEPSAYTTLQDNASSPSFKLCLEYRGDRFNPTLTLLCRVDTIHGVSKQPMVVGYAALPLFLEHRDNGGAARTAPTKATVQEFCLNTGAFQLPLRLGATLGTNEIDFSATACDGYMKLPCATILVRVCPAAKTEDGLACLSRNDVATSDWIARGVSTPAPNYADKAYDSTASRPSLAEDKLYKLRFPNTDLLVVFDVRGVKQVKGTWVSHQVGWAYLKLLNTSHCIAAGSFQLPLFSGAMSLGNMTPVGMPPSTAAKYAYDATNVQTQKKKKPLSKLVVGKTERECEKELNTTFAKDMDISHYTF